MNTKSFPPSAIINSSNKSLISSIQSHNFFRFNNTHVNISQISQIPARSRNITTKVSAAAAAAAHGVLTPAPEKETLYDLLGVPENGTLSDIKHAYKQMALKYHPDVSPPDRVEEYTVKFIRVQEAYETLSDPDARFMYDSCMAKGLAFSGKRETRFDPRSDGKKRWMEQISELQRRSAVGRNRAGRVKGMSWAARIRKQRSESCVDWSDPNQ